MVCVGRESGVCVGRESGVCVGMESGVSSLACYTRYAGTYKGHSATPWLVVDSSVSDCN